LPDEVAKVRHSCLTYRGRLLEKPRGIEVRMFALRPETAVTVSAAFAFGMVLALLGSLKLSLSKRLHLGEGRIGVLLSAFNFALMPMMLLTGLVIDRYGVRWVLILASCMTAVAVVSLGVNPTYRRAFVGVLLAGLGSAGLSTGSVVLMSRAFYSDSQMAASQNLGNVFFALGALVTPVLTDLLLRTFEFRRGVAVIATLCLVPALLASVTDRAALELTPAPADLNRLFVDQALWLAAAVFFLYAPLEAAINIWTTTYLTDLGQSERKAAWVLTGFWAAFLASRLLAALALHHWPAFGRGAHATSPAWDYVLIVLPALLVAVVLGNLAGTASGAAASRGTLLLGFLLGPIFPTLVGSLFQRLNDEKVYGYGTAYGALFAVGSLGSLVLAPLIGARATRRSVQTALRIPMVIAIGLTLAALVFALAK
jgi:fucose permease